ncbi:MAG: hypothetical protein ACP5KY_04440, partial [Thermoproteus sp.]
MPYGRVLGYIKPFRASRRPGARRPGEFPRTPLAGGVPVRASAGPAPQGETGLLAGLNLVMVVRRSVAVPLLLDGNQLLDYLELE